MTKALGIWMTTILWLGANSGLSPASLGFRKISDHFFYLESKTETANTGALITAEGVLLIDPPTEAEILVMLASLKTITSRPVRWIVFTDYEQARNGGTAGLLKQGAAFIASKELDRLMTASSVADPARAASFALTRPNPRFLFGRQMHLFPAGIEVRIMAVNGKARTAGDVFVFLPAEKVLYVGKFFTPGSFPQIDGIPGEGTAPGWIDGLKQVVESVPLLKSAMPQPKPDPTIPREPEKSLEETIAVVAAHGAPATLMQLKSLLAAAQKLRADGAKAIAAGRSQEEFVKSISPEVISEFANAEAFAAQLYIDLARK